MGFMDRLRGRKTEEQDITEMDDDEFWEMVEKETEEPQEIVEKKPTKQEPVEQKQEETEPSNPLLIELIRNPRKVYDCELPNGMTVGQLSSADYGTYVIKEERVKELGIEKFCVPNLRVTLMNVDAKTLRAFGAEHGITGFTRKEDLANTLAYRIPEDEICSKFPVYMTMTEENEAIGQRFKERLDLFEDSLVKYPDPTVLAYVFPEGSPDDAVFEYMGTAYDLMMKDQDVYGLVRLADAMAAMYVVTYFRGSLFPRGTTDKLATVRGALDKAAALQVATLNFTKPKDYRLRDTLCYRKYITYQFDDPVNSWQTLMERHMGDIDPSVRETIERAFDEERQNINKMLDFDKPVREDPVADVPSIINSDALHIGLELYDKEECERLLREYDALDLMHEIETYNRHLPLSRINLLRVSDALAVYYFDYDPETALRMFYGELYIQAMSHGYIYLAVEAAYSYSLLYLDKGEMDKAAWWCLQGMIASEKGHRSVPNSEPFRTAKIDRDLMRYSRDESAWIKELRVQAASMSPDVETLVDAAIKNMDSEP